MINIYVHVGGPAYYSFVHYLDYVHFMDACDHVLNFIFSLSSLRQIAGREEGERGWLTKTSLKGIGRPRIMVILFALPYQRSHPPIHFNSTDGIRMNSVLWVLLWISAGFLLFAFLEITLNTDTICSYLPCYIYQVLSTSCIAVARVRPIPIPNRDSLGQLSICRPL